MSVFTAVSPNLSPSASPTSSRSNSLTVPTPPGEAQLPGDFPPCLSLWVATQPGLISMPASLQTSPSRTLFGPFTPTARPLSRGHLLGHPEEADRLSVSVLALCWKADVPQGQEGWVGKGTRTASLAQGGSEKPPRAYTERPLWGLTSSLSLGCAQNYTLQPTRKEGGCQEGQLALISTAGHAQVGARQAGPKSQC